MNLFSKIALGSGSVFIFGCVLATIVGADDGKETTAQPSPEKAVQSSAQTNAEKLNTVPYHKPDIHDRASDKYIKQAMSYLGSCSKWNDNLSCMEAQDEFVRQYVNALAGDYKAQQYVIFDFSLTDGNGGPVVTNQVQACAWSKVVVNSASPYVTKQDRPMMIMRCYGLSPASLDAAFERATAISSIIATAHVHRLAVPELEYDPRSGKNETEAD